MKIIHFLLVAVLCAGCVSHHPAKNPVPIIPPTKLAPGATIITKVAPLDNSATELAALRAYAAPSEPVKSPSSTFLGVPAKTPAPAVTAPAVKTLPDPVVSVPITSTTNTAKAPKSHKLIYWLLTTVLAVPLTWAAKKYGMPLFKKFLAYVKTKNVVKNLDTLATEAKTKMEVDCKDVQKKL